MKISTLVLGMVFGFAAGWLVFGTGATPPLTPAAPPVIETRVKVERLSDSALGSDVPTAYDLVAALRSGSPGKYQSILEQRGRRWSAREVRALIDWADRARAEGNSNSFRTALHWLATAKTPAAQEELLELMSDETLSTPFRLGGYFLDGLADCDLPGVAAAARRRFERNVESGDTSWTASHGYFDLVAATGTPDDIVWLIERTEKGVGRHEAREALAKSKSADAVAYSVRLIEDGKADQEYLIAFTRHHPEAGAALLRRIIDGEVEAKYRELSAVFRAYGSCVPEEDLDEARAFLTSLRDPMREVKAVYAVEQFRRRGLDLSGFESLIAAPAAYLETATASSHEVSDAAYAIEYNRVAWTPRSTAALAHAAVTIDDALASPRLSELAEKVSAGLESHWK